MDLSLFVDGVSDSLKFLNTIDSRITPTDEATVLVLAIAGQESEWRARLQGGGGPARSYWQFESGGGVWGVMNHYATKTTLQKVCHTFDIPFVQSVIYEAMAWDDTLACCMARLLLWSDPAPLPALDAVEDAWQYYLRNWRPGAPHRETWDARYATAKSLL